MIVVTTSPESPEDVLLKNVKILFLDNTKTVFLAGPIQNTDNWQEKAIEWLKDNLLDSENLIIANPRRQVVDLEDFSPEKYAEQVDWEHAWLSMSDICLFWLAAPTSHNCERSYAQTTRFELGEAMVTSRLNQVTLIIGIEEGFSGARYIRHTIPKKNPDAFIFETLEECLKEVVRGVA